VAIVRPPGQTVLAGQTVILDGSASLDPLGQPLAFQWTLRTVPAGSAATLSGSTGAIPSFVADVAGAYVAELIVTAAGRTSAPRTVTVTAVATSPLMITITEPAPDAIVDADRVRVRGTLAGPPNTGVVVNGVVAGVQGGQYVADGVPLAAGENVITATAAAADGQTLSAAIRVSGTGVPPVLQLGAHPYGLIPPLTVRFEYTFGSRAPIESLSMDFDGDGTADLVTGDPSQPLQFTYFTPGIYIARLTVEETGGPTASAEAAIVAEAFTAVDPVFQGIWSSMHAALIAGDPSSALAFVVRHARARFGAVWQALLPQMATVVVSYSALRPYDVAGEFAEYFVTRVIDGETRIFFVYFAKGEDGVWRLETM
jgi:hypothetical protein